MLTRFSVSSIMPPKIWDTLMKESKNVKSSDILKWIKSETENRNLHAHATAV